MSRNAAPSSWSGRWRQWWQRVPGHAVLDAAQRWQRELPVSSHDYARHQTQPVRDWGLDQRLFWTVFGLLCWGLVMVYSASVALPDGPKYGSYAQWHFALRHLLSIGVGTLAAFVVFQVPIHRWQEFSPYLFVVSLVLLVLVLVPFIGKGVNGARRWISLGVMNFQPSELAKLAVLLYASGYMVRKMDIKEHFIRAVWPMALAVTVIGGLLIAEPDMGAFMVIAVIAMGILFLGGVNATAFAFIIALLLGVFVLLISTSEWRRQRVFAYLNPFGEEHVLGKGYQLSHALIAIGRGEFWGVGLGGSVEKLHWLPEAHTDFLLAVIGEEFGLVGILVLIGVFFWLTRRIMHIGHQAMASGQVFAGLVAQGVALWLGFQAFINIGVNLGALPTKGLTLPFMSYGGSAILMNLVAVAIVLRIDAENRQRMHPDRRTDP